MSTTAGKNNDKTDSVNRSAAKTRLSRKIQNEAERIARDYDATQHDIKCALEKRPEEDRVASDEQRGWMKLPSKR